MRIFILTVLTLMVTFSLRVPAAIIDETQIDIQTREIAKTLRCTVCQTENIWESGAPLARQMRDLVRERVKQGQSAEEIRGYFLSRYGDYILMEPPKQGWNWLIWGSPFVLLIVGGLFLYRELRRWKSRSLPSSLDSPPPLDTESRRRIERELHS